ncbi:MAG: TIM-barrel domain-containing protein [Bacteroidota bacterium]
MREAFLALIFFLPSFSYSQLLKVEPPNPMADDIVSIVFDASQGNKALQGYSGEVYAHTGVILGTVDEPSDWRYVQGSWGKKDERMKMERIGEDLYKIQFQIRNFYGFREEDPFLQMAFVFRNESGSLVAKDTKEKDIFYPKYKVFEHGPIEKAHAHNAESLVNLASFEKREDGSLFMRDGNQEILIRAFGKGIFNVKYFPSEKHEIEKSESVVAKPISFQNVYEGNTKDPFRIAGEDPFNIRIHQAPIRLEFLEGNQEILLDELGLFFQNNIRGLGAITGVRFQLTNDEQLYGAGARALNLNLRGQRLYCYNTAQYGYTAGETDLAISIPFILSSKGYGVFFDNPRKSYLDLGKTEDNILEYGVKDSVLSYYVILGPSPKEILERYTHLTGRQPMPPHWALGYMQGREGYKNQFELERILKKTRSMGIPMDAVLLDEHWFGGLQESGQLKWDRKSWPNPEKLINRLKEEGIQTILMAQPYFLQGNANFSFLDKNNLLTKDIQGKSLLIEDHPGGPAALFDVFQRESGNWIWPYFQEQYDKGIAGLWSSGGELMYHPSQMLHASGKAENVHNHYPLIWSRLLFEKYKMDYPDQRFFNLQSSGFAGMQRYATFPSSGAVSRSWKSLRAQLPLMLGSGLSGLAYMHSELGGYTSGPKDAELFRRWVQFGVFSPIMKVNAEADAFEPEPVFYDPTSRKIIKKAIELRYQLFPYNYQLARTNSLKGTPLARPISMEYPEDPQAWGIDDQYFWGPDLLVAPIFRKGQKYRDIYLPDGQWFDFYTEEIYRGGRAENLEVSQAYIPLLVKRGAWIPMAANLKHTGDFKGDSLDLHYYPNPTSKLDLGELYIDDGKTDENFLYDNYKRLFFSGKVKGDKVHVQIKGEGKLPQIEGGIQIFLHIHGLEQAPGYVKVFGKKVMVSDQPAYIQSPGPNSAYWNYEKSTVVVRINWNGADTLIEARTFLK